MPAFAIASDPLSLPGVGTPALVPEIVAVLHWALAILALNVLVLFAATWIARLLRERRLAQRQQFRDAWQPLLYKHMAGDTTPLPQLPVARRLDFLLLWLQTAGYVRDEDVARLNELARSLGQPDYVIRLLNDRSRWKRLLAMRAAGAMQLHKAVPALRREAASGRVRVGLAAVSALFKIAPADAMLALQTLLGDVRWGPTAVAHAVREAGSEALQVLTQALRVTPPGTALNLVRVIEALEDASALPALRDRYSAAADNDEKAAIARALGKLGDDRDRQRLLPALTSSHALLRMQAAAALGHLGLPEDVWALISLLSDRDWWVRYRAAQSLVKLTRGEPNVLAVLRAKIVDRYGLEVLDRVMAEHQVED
jgi:HEAT repeat protein